MQNWLFGLPGRIFVSVKENTNTLLRPLFTRLAFFGLVEFGLSCTSHVFLLEHLSNYYQDLCRTFFEIRTKFYVVLLSDASRNRIRPNTRLQIEGLKNQHIDLAGWNFEHWLSRCACTIIYRCIALLQLLYINGTASPENYSNPSYTQTEDVFRLSTPTNKHKPVVCSQTEWSGSSQGHQSVKYVHEHDGPQNQELFCCRGPALISNQSSQSDCSLCCLFVVLDGM
jgi:hypothetical protein